MRIYTTQTLRPTATRRNTPQHTARQCNKRQPARVHRTYTSTCTYTTYTKSPAYSHTIPTYLQKEPYVSAKRDIHIHIRHISTLYIHPIHPKYISKLYPHPISPPYISTQATNPHNKDLHIYKESPTYPQREPYTCTTATYPPYIST